MGGAGGHWRWVQGGMRAYRGEAYADMLALLDYYLMPHVDGSAEPTPWREGFGLLHGRLDDAASALCVWEPSAPPSRL